MALKFLPPELTRDDDARERFILEAQAASALDHPNICTIHEIDATPEGQQFIAMASPSYGQRVAPTSTWHWRRRSRGSRHCSRRTGTPEADKRHVIFDTDHSIPRNAGIRETLDWLDKYLGPVN